MPSQISKRTSVSAGIYRAFGFARDRTSWILYNGDSSDSMYWNVNRPSSNTDGFIIPANTAITLKIPEDDPRQELWFSCNALINSVYIYQGFNREFWK